MTAKTFFFRMSCTKRRTTLGEVRSKSGPSVDPTLLRKSRAAAPDGQPHQCLQTSLPHTSDNAFDGSRRNHGPGPAQHHIREKTFGVEAMALNLQRQLLEICCQAGRFFIPGHAFLAFPPATFLNFQQASQVAGPVDGRPRVPQLVRRHSQ